MKYYRLLIERIDLVKVIDSVKMTAIANDGEYVLAHFLEGQNELIIYDNTKNRPYKATFKGKSLPKVLLPYVIEDIESQNGDKARKITSIEQLGSDEVGFGDFFGPLVVVSAFVNQKVRQDLINYPIQDSKKLDDNTILMMGDALSKLVPHVKNIVSNPKYNEVFESGKNMSVMKAMLHHNVLTILARQQKYKGPLLIDKFISLETYRKYTAGMAEAPIVLVPKGEQNSYAIAVASILARYYFLLEMDKLSRRFQTKIPLGAGRVVDEFAKDFLKKHGRSNLESITKHNFRNFKDLAATF